MSPTATLTRDTPPDVAADVQHWTVSTRSGLALAVPPSLRSMTTYVLLEQEGWFEPEMSLLPHLLHSGVHALDIGANHGVVALEMARCSGQGLQAGQPAGQVWAFEPTQAPRQALQRSVQLNGLQQRVKVLPLALADAAGVAQFEVHDNSELNARVGNVAGHDGSQPDAARQNNRTEIVQVDTLDHVLQAWPADQTIGFIKLDAEGDELRVLAGAQQFFGEHSPLVMFEFKHGAKPNWPLLRAFSDLDFGLFRWSAEMQLMLPFDAASAETAFALNLLALRPAQQAHWASRGLLVTPQALAETALPLLPQLQPDSAPATGLAAARQAVDAAAAGALSSPTGGDFSPAQRVLLMIEARQQLLQGGSGAGAEANCLPAWVLLVHCLHALGQPLAALQMGAQLLSQASQQDWEADMPSSCLPPLRAQRGRRCSTASGLWLRQMLAEYVALHAAHSSYFEAPAPQRWAALLEHPDHSAEVERRYLLAHVISDRLAPRAGLLKLKHLHALQPDTDLNATLWSGLLQSLSAMAPGVPAASSRVPVFADNAIDEVTNEASDNTTPAAVLLALPVVPLAVVDVGASEVSSPHTPYATLVAAGRAHVTGFEPDAAALAQLRQRHAHSRHYHYEAHLVGDGQPATFHETHWSPTASLLAPNRALLDRYHNLGEHVVLKAQRSVATVRLDDVLPPGGMDLLKIDVQGAERLVFDGARERLAECLMVWTEVEFVALYEGQPLFADIDARLRAHGLQFLCFAGLAQRTLASWPLAAPAPRYPQQLWADALYVPAPERIARLGADEAARLALLAHHVAQAWDLCHAALLRVDEVSGSVFAARYLAACSAKLLPVKQPGPTTPKRPGSAPAVPG